MKNIHSIKGSAGHVTLLRKRGSSLQHLLVLGKYKTVNVNMKKAPNCKEREEYDGLSRLYTFDKSCCCPMCLLTILLEDSCKINTLINGRFVIRKHSQVYSPLCI